MNIVGGLLRVATEETNINDIYAMVDRLAGVQNDSQDEISNPVHRSSATHDSSRMHQLAEAAAALGGINQSPVHTSTNSSERWPSCDQMNTSEYHRL